MKNIRYHNMLKHINARTIRAHLIITFGLLLNALGWTAFLIPAKITGGGITGVSTLFFFGTGFPMGITYLIINAVLVVFAIKILGLNFGVKTIFSVVVLSVLFSLLQEYYQTCCQRHIFINCYRRYPRWRRCRHSIFTGRKHRRNRYYCHDHQ